VWETLLSGKCLDELALVDSILCDAGVLQPLTAFGIYRKRAAYTSTEKPSVPGTR
jgi:hypothetical protein